MEQNKQTDLNSICKDLELIIEGLATGKESYREEETRYSLEEAVDYLREYLQELKDLSRQILEYGNTPKLLKKVHDKYGKHRLMLVIEVTDAHTALDVRNLMNRTRGVLNGQM